MKQRLSSDWVRGMTKEEKEDFESQLLNSPIPDKIKEILERRMLTILDQETSEEQFDHDWAYLQAFRNGKKAVLKDLLKLFSYLDKDI